MSETEKEKKPTTEEMLKNLFNRTRDNLMLSAGEFGLYAALPIFHQPISEFITQPLGIADGTLAANMIMGTFVAIPALMAGIGWARIYDAQGYLKEQEEKEHHKRSFSTKFWRDQLLITTSNIGLYGLFYEMIKYHGDILGQPMTSFDAGILMAGGAAAIVGQAFGGTYAYFAAKRREEHANAKKKKEAPKEKPAPPTHTHVTIHNTPQISPYISSTPHVSPQLKNETHNAPSSTAESKAEVKQTKEEKHSSQTTINKTKRG